MFSLVMLLPRDNEVSGSARKVSKHYCFIVNSNCMCVTIYHKSFKAEKFCSFCAFCMSTKLFYMKVQDGTVQIWINRKYEGFCESFFAKVYVYNLL